MEAGGEPVDLARTISSHGLASLPPFEPLDERRSLRVTLPVRSGEARTVTIGPGRSGYAAVEFSGRRPARAAVEELTQTLRNVLALDSDLSDFYALAADDPQLSWVCRGAGRMIRSPSLFEEVVKTICTTNCAWSSTIKMVSALVEHLGPPAPNAPETGWQGRAFPTAEKMAAQGEDFYRDVVRAGYRGRYFMQLSELVASGEVDLESWGRATRDELDDVELAVNLQSLPGVGPYAAAHIMMMIGRHSLLILDSWTRPTYARLVGRKKVSDVAIQRRFKRYKQYAGLAFWLYLTEGWVSEKPMQ